MPSTPDRKPGPLEEDEELRFGPNLVPPTQFGAMNYDGASFRMYDSLGIFNPRDAASFDDILIDDFGRIVYVGNGLFVLRG
jgi:hypothetical protein